MNTVLWILQGILAAVFLGAGATKLIRSKAALETRMGWVGDFASGPIKSIGLLEILAGLGLILPAAFDVAPVLTPWAATGLMILMVGAVFTHARRKEALMILPTVILVVTAAVAAWGRFGPYSQ